MIRDISEEPVPRPAPPPKPAPEPKTPPPPRRPGLRGGTALLLVVASLVTGITGGVIGANLDRILPGSARQEVRYLAAGDVSDAAEAVLPSVVILEQVTAEGDPLASGSGLIVDRERGIIVTNSHVIEQERTTDPAERIKVIFADGREAQGTVLGNDPFTDVAVVRVGEGLPLLAEVKLAPEAEVKLGAAVIAIGSPGAGGRTIGILSNTVTSGIVSAVGRSLPRTDLRDIYLDDLIQTDAPVNSGMSGGPLVMVATKEVVGLLTLVLRSSGEEGLAFAISARTVVAIADEIIASGKVIRGSLGISFRESGTGATLVVSGPDGALVTSVPPDSPGASAGLRTGDVIVRVNDLTVDFKRPLRSILLGFRPGDVVTLTIVRDGQEQRLSATLGERQ